MIILAGCGPNSIGGDTPDASSSGPAADASSGGPTADASSGGPADAATPPQADAAVCPFIIGGNPDTGDAPTGAIVVRTSAGAAWHVDCTGTLIAPTFVLTAAHCLSPQVLGNLQVGFALGTDLTSVSDAQVHHEAQRHVHPMFSAQKLSEGLATDVYDLAVLELAEPVTSVTPAKIVRPQDDALIHAGTSVRIVGYGVTSNNGQDIGTKRIATTTLGTVQSAEMIVGVPGQPQKCNGDSGGPSYLDVKEACVTTPRIIGTTSRPANQMLNCQEPGIDTRVSYHLQWLGSIVPFSCDSGLNTTPCP
jgi:secreted trypsin-like serine protease